MATDFEDSVEVGRFTKNAQAEVVGRLVRAYGVPCADVRVFALGVNGKPTHTKAGLCLRVEQLPELRKLVDALAAAAAPDGAAPPTPAPAAPTPDGDDEGEMA